MTPSLSLLTLVFILLNVISTTSLSINLKPIHPSAPKVNDRLSNNARKKERALQQDFESIRIHADYSNLLGIDPAKEEYIQNQVMPSVISYFQATLKVQRFDQKLRIDQQCGSPNLTSNLANTEIDADLFVLVSAVNIPSANFLVNYTICAISQTDNRPFFGILYFNLASMSITTHADRQTNFKTAIREFVHLLGFIPSLFASYVNPATGEPYQYPIWMKKVNGGYVGVLSIEPLTTRLREYFGCPWLEGAYLENQGGLDTGIAYHYLERRIFNNEIMTANLSAESVISEFTLALLESTGWYKPNYNMTEPFNWGRGEGCQFVDGPCVNRQDVPNFEEFCDPVDNIACTFTARGIGYCGVGVAIDPFADNCPYYTFLPPFDCENPGNQIASLLVGEFYGESSRCYTATLAQSADEVIKSAYCFSTNCTQTENGIQLQLNVGNHTINCDKKESVSVPGYFGKLDCPDPNEFCLRANLAFCQTGCSGRGQCIDNKCQCPAGWGGNDCSERILEIRCGKCGNTTDQGCYGDQCILSEKQSLESQSFSVKIQTLNEVLATVLSIIVISLFV